MPDRFTSPGGAQPPVPTETSPGVLPPEPRRPRLAPATYLVLRNTGLFVGITALMGAAWVLAFLLRFDFQIPEPYTAILAGTLASALLAKAIAVQVFSLQHASWRYAGIKDMEAIVKAAALGSALLLAGHVLAGLRIVPRSVYAVDLLLSTGLLGGLRMALRLVYDRLHPARNVDGTRLLLVGAGDTAEHLLRQLQGRSSLNYSPIAIVDDNPARLGMRLHGVPVHGTVDDIPKLVESHQIEEIIIATPSATGSQTRRITQICRGTGLRFRLLPPTEEVLAGAVSWRQLREVAIEDLLRREPIELDLGSMAHFLEDRVVLVTGAGGSIGSEICRQVLHWRPRLLVCVEQAENPLFFLDREIRQEFPGARTALVVADVSDEVRINDVMRRHRPVVVIHAAAHKHVPMMEANVPEAVKNNVFGTLRTATAAARWGAETFLMISTDKAVNPTSIMGATKRMSELVVQRLGMEHSGTRFVAVRFGNVLGSNGSVVPIFKAQIAAGGPVTVTHPKMTRYFMTIPEATRLVLQAAALGGDGNVFVLDMGEPVKIVDLARDLIRLSGLEPGVDIDIKFSGVRPGEKLYEELSLDGEETTATLHGKIFVGKVKPLDPEELDQGLAQLLEAANRGEEGLLRRLLSELIPEGMLRTSASDSGQVATVRPTEGAASLAVEA